MNKIFIISLVFCISSCSSYYTGYSEQHYRRSVNGKELVVPPPLFTGNISHFYDLPAQTPPAPISVVPPED